MYDILQIGNKNEACINYFCIQKCHKRTSALTRAKYSSGGMISCFILLNTAISFNTYVLSVEWYHNNEHLMSVNDLQQINDTYIESKITINNIQLEDALAMFQMEKMNM